MSVASLAERRRSGNVARRNLLAGLDEDETYSFDWALIRGFGPYIRPFRRPALASAALMVLYTAANLANPYLIGLAIDRFIARGDGTGLGRDLRGAAGGQRGDVAGAVLAGLDDVLGGAADALPAELATCSPTCSGSR